MGTKTKNFSTAGHYYYSNYSQVSGGLPNVAPGQEGGIGDTISSSHGRILHGLYDSFSRRHILDMSRDLLSIVGPSTDWQRVPAVGQGVNYN